MAGPVARKLIGVAQLTGVVGVAGVLVAAVLLPFTGGLGLAARNSVQAFDDQPCDVNPTTPSQRSTMYAADGTAIASFYNQNRTVVQAKDIPKVMRQAITAIEDRRFYEHHGVDPESLLRALIKNSQSGTVVQGGSTLTMQYVKNVRLYAATNQKDQEAATEQSSGRKLIEARCALELENKFSKDEILTSYLNIAYFGASAYGVEAASKTYFNKSAKKLTIPEAALLAGLVQSPVRFDPYRRPDLAKTRRNDVLNDMLSLGYITGKQATAAKALPIKVAPKPKSSGKDCANTTAKIVNAGFFCDWAKLKLKEMGFPQERLETGGFQIYTTLNPTVQNQAQGAMPFAEWNKSKAVAVTDMIDPKTGNVLAFAVSRKYGVDQNNRNVTSNPLNVKPTAGAGSTYKTFTLVSALQNKVPLRAFKINVGNQYTSTICKNGSEPYTVGNAGAYKEGDWNLEDATYKSVNTFFVALLDQRFNCDLSGPVKAAQAMGLEETLKTPNADGIPAGKAFVEGKQATFTLGPNATSPLELASAYAVLANDGKWCPPNAITKIAGPDKKPVALPERKCEQRISPGIARTVTQVLEKDTSRDGGTAVGAFQGLASGSRPIAGKTGTASGRRVGDGTGRDDRATGNSALWFVGYTPEFAGVTAVFDPKNTAVALTDVPGREGDEVFGAYSARIWRNGMEAILRDRTWSFPPEDPEVVNGDSIPIPSVTGLDVNAATGILSANGFQVKLSDEFKDSAVPKDFVAAQSPDGRGARGMTITLYRSSGKPPAGENPGGTPGGTPGPGGRPGNGGPGNGGPGGLPIPPPGD